MSTVYYLGGDDDATLYVGGEEVMFWSICRDIDNLKNEKNPTILREKMIERYMGLAKAQKYCTREIFLSAIFASGAASKPHKQLVDLLGCVIGLEPFVAAKIMKMKKSCKKLPNMSLPELSLNSSMTPMEIMADPRIFCDVVNSIIIHLNSYNLNSFLSNKPQKISLLSPSPEPPKCHKIEVGDLSDPSNLSRLLEELTAAEAEICPIAVEVEKYYVAATSKMNEAFELCKKYRKIEV